MLEMPSGTGKTVSVWSTALSAAVNANQSLSLSLKNGNIESEAFVMKRQRFGRVIVFYSIHFNFISQQTIWNGQ